MLQDHILLSASGISKTYPHEQGDVIALRVMDIQLKAGEITVIVGASGSGKSTLLNILGLIQSSDSGLMSLKGKDALTLKEHELSALRREMIGFLYQDGGLIEGMSILENVALPLMYRNIKKDIRNKKAKELLEKTGLINMLDRKTGELSGGELQRAGLARALIMQPDILICDEPTAPLDKQTSLDIIQLLRRQADQGSAIVIATHDNLVMDASDIIIKLSKGF